ncbi:hypothetical protein JYQ62_22160 [Nostoc sp. UHCC 0702]|nr:hypothetical protein JYQ62_22160 [Nostoc sp. UHCC 0702]
MGSDFDEVAALYQLSCANRIAYRDTQVVQQRKERNSAEASAKIVSYDASTGFYKVELTDGKMVIARAISNSAALSKGSLVSLVMPAGGTPIIDAMPR